jgi:DNA repair exonuclease SbcCD nuclease subunit
LYVTGDLHGYIDIGKLNSKRFPINRDLSKDDYVIIAGDFGLVWDNKNDELYWRKWLARKNFSTLFIDGNHENFQLLNSYPVENWNGGNVHRISESIIHLMRGQIFTIKGYKIFTFGGAQSHDKEYRKENVNWWPEEMPSLEEYHEGIKNLERHKWEVDFVITHMCPTSTLLILNESNNTGIHEDQLSDYLEQIKERLSYKKWYFGHFHRDMELPNKQKLIYKSIEEHPNNDSR